MDDALGIGRMRQRRIGRRAVEVELDQIGSLHHAGRAGSGDEEAVGPLRMAQADMTEGVEHVLAGEDVVGRD
jgi:hypothetical protein